MCIRDRRGNVRELENAMHRAILLSRGNQIEVEDLASTLGTNAQNAQSPSPISSLGQDAIMQASIAANAANRNLVGRTIENVEQEMILETLKHCLGNRTHAAVILGISIRTLRNKLKQYSDAGLDIPAPQISDGKYAIS